MENLNQIFILIAQEKGISLNLDILETGVINIVILIGILIVNGINFLGTILKERKTVIVQNVQDAEDRLTEAQNRLTEAQKQLNQLSVIIAQIQEETFTTKKLMLEADASETQKDLQFRFERALNTFKSKERQIFFEIKDQITSLVLNRTILHVQETFTQEKKAANFINNIIRTLELPS